MEKVLEVKNVTKKYQTKEGEITALKNVNLRVNKCEFVSIIGPSGCGKSTLLSIIAGLEEKSSGEIYIENEKVVGISDKIGYMLQRDCLLEWKTIFGNTVLGLQIKKELTKENIEYVESLLKKYGLYEFKNKYPSELSGGEQQRVSVARALAKRPRVLFLDEPTGALDEQTGRQVLDYICKLQKEYGFTIVMVTHNLNIAEMAHTVIKMNSGKISEIYTNETQKTAFEIGW